MDIVRGDETVRGLLERQAHDDGDRVYCRFGDGRTTLAALDTAVNRLANGLVGLGLRPGDRVAVMLPNHPDHVLAVLALVKLGLVWVPVNVGLKDTGLEYLIGHSEPRCMLVDARYGEQALPILERRPVEQVVWRGGSIGAGAGAAPGFDELAALADDRLPPYTPNADDVLCILYTSGTTGPPKGVCVTDRMLRASAAGVTALADVWPGDTMFLWEPLYHVGGAQMLVLALARPVTLALVERFSASGLWDEVRRYGATHLHYLGGVTQILLRQPPRPDDADNPVRVAWGAGCPPGDWRAFERRFGVQVRECYGMTESSSIVTANTEGRVGSIGRPLPYFEVEIVDDSGNDPGPGVTGEIVVLGKERGLLTRGYFRDAEATGEALREGRLYTGDLGRRDAEGFFYFAGRKTDSVRRRGENVSAWEVERVLNEHPRVEESAVIGVPADVGEEDIKAFIRPAGDQHPEPLDLVRWCEARLAAFQVPRYIAFVDAFEKTPSERIIKAGLSRSVENSFDLERS